MLGLAGIGGQRGSDLLHLFVQLSSGDTLIHKPVPQMNDRVPGLLNRLNLVLRAVDPVVVGICVTVKTVHIKDHNLRFSVIPHFINQRGKFPGKFLGEPAVHGGYRNAVKALGRSVGTGEECIALGLCGDGKSVVLYKKEYRKLLAHRMGHGLKDLTLLTHAVSQSAEDHGIVFFTLDGFGNSGGLQGAVPHGSDDTQYFSGRVAHMSVHLTSPGVGTVFVEK